MNDSQTKFKIFNNKLVLSTGFWNVVSIVLIFILIINDQLMLQPFIFIMNSIFFIYKNREAANKFKTLIFTIISVSSIICFFVSRVIAFKYFNIRYAIEPEYLKFTTDLYAFLFTIFVIYGIFAYLIGFYISMSILWQNHKVGVKILSRLFNGGTLIIIATLSFYISNFVNNHDQYLLLADAYPYTDCDISGRKGWYIRKNHKACYRIDFEKKELFLQEIIAVKP